MLGGAKSGATDLWRPPPLAHSFDSEEEAIARANDTPFGLAAGIWTNDANRVERVVPQLKAGTTWVNCYNIITPGFPFGGLKESGIGTDMGEESIVSEYTTSRTVFQAIAKAK